MLYGREGMPVRKPHGHDGGQQRGLVDPCEPAATARKAERRSPYLRHSEFRQVSPPNIAVIAAFKSKCIGGHIGHSHNHSLERLQRTQMLSKQALRRVALANSLPKAARSGLLLRRELATPAANPPSSNDPFANGTNAYYVEEMYRYWRQDPKSVHLSWDVYFSGMDKGLPSYKAFQPPPSTFTPPADGAPALYGGGGAELDDHLKVRQFFLLLAALFICIYSGAITCASIPSSRTSHR